MRPTRVLAAVATSLVAVMGVAAEGDGDPPPTFNLWNRPGIWRTTTDKKSPFPIGDMIWAQADDAQDVPTGLVLGTWVPPGASGPLVFGGTTTGNGQAVKGSFGFPLDGGGGASGRFAVKIVDTARYEQFKGKFWLLGSHGFALSGTYQPGPVAEETGSAKLRLLLFATHPQSHLGTSKIRTIRRKDLPAKVAFVGVVQNAGPDLLPRGVAKLRFTVRPGESDGVTLPGYLRVQRVVDPVEYQYGDVFHDSWIQTATMGALGSAKDRCSFAVVAYVPAGFARSSLSCTLDVVSNAPGFTLTTQDVSSSNATPNWLIDIVE